MAAKKYVWIVVPKYGKKYVVGRFSAEETAKKYVQTLNAPFNYLIKKQAVESDPEMKSNPVKKKFSPAQIAAQKLFAERARAGTLGKGKRKAAVKRKANPVTETLIYGLAPGETRDYMEELLYAGGLKLTPAEIDKVLKAASNDGYHSFRIAGFDPTMKPDFAKAVKRNLSKSQIAAASKVMAKRNPDKSKPRAYVKRASQATGAPPSKRLLTRRKKALSAPAGYFPNPSTNRGLAIFLDAVALGETFSESKLIEALDHPSLSVSDRNVIRDALKGLPYSHIRLQDAAMKIRNYKGERKTNPDKTKPRANPMVKKPKKYYQVSIMQEGLHTKFMGLANFFTFSEAENYANHLAKQHKNWTIRVHDIRAM